MEGYELTDRGKIVLAAILVVLFLFLPAALMTYCAMTSQASGDQDDQQPQTSSAPPTQPHESAPPVISQSPPPSGGGFNPPDTSSPPDNIETDPPNGQGHSPPPGPGQSSVNPTEGTLSFLFSQNSLNKLDDETESMLDVFLSSPKNTENSIIAVETPILPLDITEVFVPVIVDALTSRGIEESRIAHITDPTIPLADAFEVNLFYLSQSTK